jgi:hypothetical protein
MVELAFGNHVARHKQLWQTLAKEITADHVRDITIRARSPPKANATGCMRTP